MLHLEGIRYILGRTFPIDGGTWLPAATWKVGVSGLNAMANTATPTGETVPPLSYSKTAGYAQLNYAYANEGGGMDTVLRGLFGYERKTATIDVAFHGRSTIITVAAQQFGNDLAWAPRGVPADVPPWVKLPWEPVHGYPWDVPRWEEDSFTPSVWAPILAGNPRRGCTFSLGMSFVVTDEASPKLLLSSPFYRALQIQPGGSLWVANQAIFSPERSTSYVLFKLIKQAFAPGGQDLGYNWELSLGKTPASSLGFASTLADAAELDAQINEGYAPRSIDAWELDADWETVIGSASGWFWNHGSQPWEEARTLLVTCRYDSDPDRQLAFWQALPSPLILQPDDRLSVPTGVKWRLAA